jgi:WD40 repeat protein/DNA-binding SARP family transcriptional activator/tRNA A-37 threonylcarbamoyl transferase component Bud32
MSERLEIRTLGGLAVERDGQPVTGFVSRTAEALLVYLAYTRQPYPREVLAEFLWPYRERETALANLRTVLASLRKLVGPYVLTGDPASLNPAGDCWLDAADFEARLEQPAEQIPTDLEETLDLYQGEFLQGVYVDSAEFDAWASLERERLRLAAMGGLDRLITAYASQGDYRKGIVTATRLLQMDRVREQTHRQLMRLLALSGQRGKALEQYDLCRQVLAEEHGVEPEPATTELYEQIRAGKPLEAPAAVKPIRGYELREQIGAGAFGAVYRAYQPVVGREVAIKVIKPEYADQPDFIRRFETEARLWARLEHPFIVPLYDYWREPGGAYLVMRYLPGTLRDRLQRGPLSLSETTRLVEQIAAALTVAHRSGVIHRDLKPANLLMDNEGNAYLGDFGIAKALVQTSETTQEGQIVGSPGYLSPERIKGEPVSPGADLYSFGVVIYEVLTGQHPFPGDLTPSALLYKQLSEPLPSVHERRPELPAALDAVIQGATAKDPADRYPDALSLASAFREAAGALAPVPSEEKVVPLVRTPVEGERTWTPADHLVTLRNPYKGLHAFEEGDAADFFGREALVEQLLARLAQDDPLCRFLAVVGPSGSGKSSVVKAGLIPALRRGALPESDRWFIAEMLPGAHPMEELEIVLTRLATRPPANLVDQLRRDERGLLRAARLVLPDQTALLLVVDQFEEVFTLVENPGEAAQFMESLCAAVTDPRSPLRVIVTLRADFYDRPLMHPHFSRLVSRRTHVVVPLTADELEQAISAPAEGLDMTLEPGLVAAMVADIHQQPGALPLLQYALTELFEHREDHVLTLRAYHAIGGTLGALARRANDVYRGLPAEDQEAARQVFLRLVTLGEGTEDTRRRTLQSELLSVGGNSPAIQRVITAFDRSRLLSFDRDPVTRGPTVEVAHEAILREWRQLQLWLDDSRADVRQQRLLAAAAAEWLSADRDASYLLTGARLAQFEDWAAATNLALTQDEGEFLEASLAEEQRQEDAERERQAQEVALQKRAANRLRYLVVGLAVFLIVAAALVVVTSRALSTAETNLRQAWNTQALFLADLSQKQGELGDKRRAVLLALEGLAHYADGIHNPENHQALLNALAPPGLEQLYLQHGGPVDGAAWNASETQVMTWSEDGAARVWDAVTGEPLLTLQHDGPVWGAAWDWSETRILSWSKDTTARVWDAHTGDLLLTLAHDSPVSGAAWDKTEAHLLTWSDKTVRVWDTASGAALLTLAHEDTVRGAAWNRDETRLLTWSEDYTVRVRDAASGATLLTLRHDGPAWGAAWNGDETRILTWSWDNTARVWDANSGQVLLTLPHDDPVVGAAWNSDETRQLTWSWDDTARVWDAVTGEMLLTLRHSGNVHGAVWSANETRLLTWSDDGFARVWDARRGSALRTLPQDGPVTGAAWNGDETRVLTWSEDGTARVWDVASGNDLLTVHHDDSENGVRGAVWSRDETRLLTWSGDGTARAWTATSGEAVLEVQHTDAVVGAAWNSDETALLTWSQDDTARVWDAVSGKLLLTLPHEDRVKGAAWNRDNTRILTWMAGAVRIWDASSGKEWRIFPSRLAIEGSAWSGDETHLLVWGTRSTAGITWQVWDADSGDVVVDLPNVGTAFEQGWSGDGTRLLAASTMSVVVWDTTSGKVLFTLPHTRTVTGAAWNRDGTRILTWAAGTAQVWDAASGKTVLTLDHQEQVTGATWSPDEARVLTWSGSAARVWDATSGRELLTLAPKESGIAGMVWSRDGTRVLAWAQDSLWVWNTTSGEALFTVSLRDQVGGATWNADGTHLLTWSGNSVQIWTTDLDQLIKLAESLHIRPLSDDERARFFLSARASAVTPSS